MSNSVAKDTQALVQTIFEDTSAYEELGLKLEKLGNEGQSELLSILRDENPPLLGTGPVQ